MTLFCKNLKLIQPKQAEHKTESWIWGCCVTKTQLCILCWGETFDDLCDMSASRKLDSWLDVQSLTILRKSYKQRLFNSFTLYHFVLKDLSGIVRFFRNCKMSFFLASFEGTSPYGQMLSWAFRGIQHFHKVDYAIYAITLQLHINKIFLTVLAYLHPNSLSKTCANAEHWGAA